MRQDRPTTTILFITVFFFIICVLFGHVTPSEWFDVGAFISIFGLIVAFFVALISAWHSEHPDQVPYPDVLEIGSAGKPMDDEDD